MTGLVVVYTVLIHFLIPPAYREKEVAGERIEVNRSPAWGKGVSKGTNKS